MKKRFYQTVTALVLTAALTVGATAATAKSDVFVGSTDLSKTIYDKLNSTSSSFIIEGIPDSDHAQREAMLEALAQNPYAAHATGWNYVTYPSRGYTEFTPTYVLKESVRKKQYYELKKKVKSVVAKIIKKGMTTEQKVDAIQRYIATNCEYSYDTLNLHLDGTKAADYKYPDSFTPYGALIGGKAVCQGYAKAFKALADEAGVRNVLIYGKTNKGIPHSWNRIYDKKTWKTIDVSNLDLKMWQQTDTYVAEDTVNARLIPNKQTIVDSQWNSLFKVK